ncbi:MAG: molybdopterin-dependent oxidoreductase [Vicinamibacterales bacterium]
MGRTVNAARVVLALLALVDARPVLAQARVDVVTLEGKTVSVALDGFTRHVVTTSDHTKKATFEGVLLRDALVKAGTPMGEALHGAAALTRYVKVSARDGYAVVFSIAELDSGFTDEIVLLADIRDNQRLVSEAGPLQVVVPHEKRAGRWIRQVSKIEVLAAK